MFKRKFFILFLAGVFLLPMPLSAQDSETQKQTLIKEVLEITKALEIWETMKQVSLAQFDQNLKAQNIELTPEQRAAAKEVMIGVFDEMQDDLWAMVIGLYTDNYSEDELSQLVEFYKTDLGQMFINKLPQISAQVLQETNRLVQGLQPEIQRRLTEKFLELEQNNSGS